MSYQKDRDEFVGVIVEECDEHGSAAALFRAQVPPEKRGQVNGGSTVELARLILRNATIIQRIAVNECNRKVTANESMAEARAMTRIQDACKPWGIKPTFDGDPRGACVKLLLPSGRWNSLGGPEDGFCVPTR